MDPKRVQIWKQNNKKKMEKIQSIKILIWFDWIWHDLIEREYWEMRETIRDSPNIAFTLILLTDVGPVSHISSVL